MALFSSAIPRRAVDLLFAEDLINRIMRRHTGEEIKTWRGAPYRDFVYNAFSDDIGEAVDFIDVMLEWEVDEAFSRMVDEHQVNRDAFVHYALHHEELCFKQGFDADNFLNFCVRLASLATYFDQYGVPLALELALFFVVKVMSKYDLFEGGWDTLNAVAKTYIEKKEDFYNVLTPDLSDEESFMNVPDDDVENEDEYFLFNEDDDIAVNNEKTSKDESNSETCDSSVLKSELPTSTENMAKSCILNEDDNFTSEDEKEPKDKLDRAMVDSSGLKSESTTSSENMAECYVWKEDHDFPVNDEKEPKEESDHETMDSSGLKSKLPTDSKNMAEGYASNKDCSFPVNDEKKPSDESDHQMMDLSRSELDLLAISENGAEGCISNADDESVIIQDEKPQKKPDVEGMDLSQSKLDFPACSENEENLATSVFRYINIMKWIFPN